MQNKRNRYALSSEFLSKAEKVIPLGSQTFSKSFTQYPRGIAPLFASKAKGANIWDIDGNKYVDLVNSLAAVTLGYCDDRVDKAVRKQLKEGVIFSLPGMLELQVAEKICELVPSGEMVRFAKNGTDATSGAIRIARAYTNRKVVAMCGYHGWQDWSIGTTSRNKGIPEEVSSLTVTFNYNDINSLTDLYLKFPGQIAAVILEPMNTSWPTNNFLNEIREVTKKNGSVLIFDETVTGFRYSEGGAQKEFGVTPDLTTLGKGIANGFPLSVVTGSKEIMSEMTEVFFSGTFGGELLSLSAANAVLDLHLNGEIVPVLKQNGERLAKNTEILISQLNLKEVVSLSGHPSWKIINWNSINNTSSAAIKTLFLQEMFLNGVLIIGSHNVSTALRDGDFEWISQAYERTLSKISTALNNDSIEKYLEVQPLVPLFKVR